MLNKLIYLSDFIDNTTLDPHGVNSLLTIRKISNNSIIPLKSNGFITPLGGTERNFYLAISNAMLQLNVGDVLFINQSITMHKSDLPLIFDRLLFDLTDFLSNKGITVILSSGNSNYNLETECNNILVYPSKYPKNTKAILVGSQIGSNSGSFVKICNPLPTRISSFEASSEASAIVAGIVLEMQNYSKSIRHKYLLTQQIKKILNSQPLKNFTLPFGSSEVFNKLKTKINNLGH
jgi:hypothetical protein